MPRSEFLLLPLRCSQPKQTPQHKQRQNVRLWRGGGQRLPPVTLTLSCHRLPAGAHGAESKVIDHFASLNYANKVFSLRCC